MPLNIGLARVIIIKKNLEYDAAIKKNKVPGGGNGNLLHFSCLENPINRGAWRAVVHGISKKQT